MPNAYHQFCLHKEIKIHVPQTTTKPNKTSLKSFFSWSPSRFEVSIAFVRILLDLMHNNSSLTLSNAFVIWKCCHTFFEPLNSWAFLISTHKTAIGHLCAIFCLHYVLLEVCWLILHEISNMMRLDQCFVFTLLFALPFLMILNTLLAFFLVAAAYWANDFRDSQDLFFF